MRPLIGFLDSFAKEPLLILEASIPLSAYTSVDLSDANPDLKNLDIARLGVCQDHIDRILRQNSAKVAYGGYLEQRNLYKDKAGFTGVGERSPRNIHLGMDFWARAGTKVIVPIEGKVHSFRNNGTKGDYGPTIVLEHRFENIVFYTLYGHLSIASLNGLYVGKKFGSGQPLATLGTQDINVGYAPHLHFQVIKDMQGNRGDYPGVCSRIDLNRYRNNCPDPDLLLKMDWTP